MIVILAFITLAACHASCMAQDESPTRVDGEGWVTLLSGAGLDGWSRTNFGGEGEVTIATQPSGKVVQFDFGHPMTGVTYTGTKSLPSGELPTIDYELELDAARVAGGDFFCGLTFPYKDSHCTLILGGWGGQLVGLSSLDGEDASQNETTDFQKFELGKWYRIRLKVTASRIEARLDGRQIVTCRIGQRKVSTRPEVARSRPLGIASYQTQARIRDVRFRRLTNVNKTEQSMETPLKTSSH